MKTITIPHLDEKDEPTIQWLVDNGLDRISSEIAVFLDHVEESTATDIERGTGRRVTEVSRALRGMRRRGWICETRHPLEQPKGGRSYYYRNSLTMIIDGMVYDLQKNQDRFKRG